MFDLRQLRYFVAVAEELSFTRAAARLHISQPPLSQQILALEHDLGARLFDRDKRNVALTEPGRILLHQARQILAQAEEARREVSQAAAGFSGTLRVAYTVSVSFHRALPQALLRFGQRAPQVRVQLFEMYTGAQFAALLAGQLDVGFVRDVPASAADARNLQLDVIDREPLLLALPSGHRLARRRTLRMGDVAGEPFVAQPRELAATLHDRLTLLASKADFHPSIRQHAQQLNGLLALVAAGIGLALVPASLQAVRLAGVTYVPLEDPDACLLLAMVSRVGDQSPVLAQWLELARGSGAALGL